ncbi:hypothetical protein [Streptomyces sp. NPDC004100]
MRRSASATSASPSPATAFAAGSSIASAPSSQTSAGDPRKGWSSVAVPETAPGASLGSAVSAGSGEGASPADERTPGMWSRSSEGRTATRQTAATSSTPSTDQSGLRGAPPRFSRTAGPVRQPGGSAG